MMLNYFEYNGKKYYSGTVIRIKAHSLAIEEKAIFLGYNTAAQKYVITKRVGGCQEHIKNDMFYSILIEPTSEIKKAYAAYTDEFNAMAYRQTHKNELDIEGMFIAWIWYIIIMLFSVLLNDRIYVWIFASIVFFNYRSSKLGNGGARQ